jgi:hypothetical protein
MERDNIERLSTIEKIRLNKLTKQHKSRRNTQNMKKKRRIDKTANAETTGIVRMGNTLCRILKKCKEVKQGRDWTMIVDGCTGDTLQIQDLMKPRNDGTRRVDNEAYDLGYDSYWERIDEGDNPYDEDSDGHRSWEQGWRMGREFDEDNEV